MEPPCCLMPLLAGGSRRNDLRLSHIRDGDPRVDALSEVKEASNVRRVPPATLEIRWDGRLGMTMTLASLI